MKELSILLIALLGSMLVTITGCKKQEPDPCANITCLNGGTCANGSCNCPDGYTGSDCSQQETPSQIRITKVVVDEFPPLDNGSDWDGAFCGGANPDILVEIEDGNGVIFTSQPISDCIPGNSYTFTSGLPKQTDNVNSVFVVRLYDYDTGGCAPSDYMGGLQKPIYDSNNGFPSTIGFFNSTYELDITLHVEYIF